MEFKVGDVVILKSGGPSMTVNSVDISGVFCVWFDSKGETKSATFLAEMLNHY